MKKVTVKARKSEYKRTHCELDPETKEKKSIAENVETWTPEVPGFSYIRELSVDKKNNTITMEINDEDAKKIK